MGDVLRTAVVADRHLGQIGAGGGVTALLAF